MAYWEYQNHRQSALQRFLISPQYGDLRRLQQQMGA